MVTPESARASQVLLALADLAPSSDQRVAGLTVPTEWFRWLSVGSVHLFDANYDLYPPPPIDRRTAERLASVDQIRPNQSSLRTGWLFVAGRIVGPDGRSRRVFRPLVTVPVRVDVPPVIGPGRLVRAGDVSVSDLVEDREERHRLEANIQTGGGAIGGDQVAAPAGSLRDWTTYAFRSGGCRGRRPACS